MAKLRNFSTDAMLPKWEQEQNQGYGGGGMDMPPMPTFDPMPDDSQVVEDFSPDQAAKGVSMRVPITANSQQGGQQAQSANTLSGVTRSAGQGWQGWGGQQANNEYEGGANDGGTYDGSGIAAGRETGSYDRGANNEVGHDGTTSGGMTREQYRDAWMSSGISNMDQLRRWVAQHGGQVVSDNGTVRTPFGETLDMLQNARTGNGRAAWSGLGGNSGGRGGGGSGSGSGGSGGGGGVGFGDELKKALAGLFPGGMFNQDIVNTRTQGARENLERFRKSQQSGNSAILAARGLLGDGAEVTAYDRLSNDIADKYSTAANDIWANESENADARMAQALSIAAGLTLGEAQNAIARFRAENDFALGQGQLALGNLHERNWYDLGRRGDDLSRAELEERARAGDRDAQIELIRISQGGATNTRGGYR